MLLEIIQPIADALLEPFTRVTEPSERLHWPYLASSFALAIAVYAHGRRGPMSWRGLGGYLFSPKLWLHPSSRLDLKIMFSNAVLRAFLVTPWMLSAFGLAVTVVGGLDAAFGTPPPLALPRWSIAGLYTVTLFVFWDVSRYALHRLLHEIPFLWEFHKVHHSAEVLTPLALYRVHPVESTLSALRGAFVTGITAGLFFYFFRSRAIQMELLGVNALAFAVNLLGANLRHSQVWLSFGKFERYFLSPAQHQIHHSADPRDFNRNYGTWLALWDRLGGTLTLSGARRNLQFGLLPGEAGFQTSSLRASYVQPVFLAFRRLAGYRRFDTTTKV